MNDSTIPAERTAPEHPWTRGPWEILPHEYRKDRTTIRGDRGEVYIVTDVTSSPDAELIALVPELADAVLALDDAWRCSLAGAPVRGHAENAIAVLADRLRKIGGTA